MKPRKGCSLAALQRRYERLAGRLAKTGLVLQGTITQRTLHRPHPEAPGQQKTYGPYYQWTWKQEGKTVTVNLTAPQAKAYQRAIDNHRRLTGLLREMRALSLQILEATTPSVQRRKTRNRKEFPLS
jgi:hypothetical protein